MSTGFVSGEIQRELSLADAFISLIDQSISNPFRTEDLATFQDDLEHDMTTLMLLQTMIDEGSRRYTLAVANDRAPYDEELDDRIKGLWRSWIRLANVIGNLYAKVPARSKSLVEKNMRLHRYLSVALEYQKCDFDHHANAVIAAYEFPLESFKDSKFPKECWNSAE